MPPLPQFERFSDRMKGVLTSEQILERDSAGASHRILVQGNGDGFGKDVESHLRGLDSRDAVLLYKIRSKLERLAKTDLGSHALFRHLEKGQVTPLAEEALFWDILLPKGQTGLSPRTAQTLIETYNFLHNLPREVHQFFPVFLEGYNLGHSTRVGIYSSLIAQKLGDGVLSPEVAAQAGFLHDIGKAHPIVNRLVRLPDVLTQSEYEQVKIHPLIGAVAWTHAVVPRMAPTNDVATLVDLHDGILEHHVRPDGLGYPSFIEPHRHSLVAKVIAVADSFDAMTSNRKYRRRLGMTLDYAREELKRCSGMTWDRTITKGTEPERQFDPKLVRLFLELDPIPIFHCLN